MSLYDLDATMSLNSSQYNTRLLEGMLGVSATVGGAIISSLNMVEQYLRIASLLIGITVGLLSAYRLLRGRRVDS